MVLNCSYVCKCMPYICMQLYCEEANNIIISEDEINGTAFMDLEDKYLSEKGFKKGQRVNILKIIQSVKVR